MELKNDYGEFYGSVLKDFWKSHHNQQLLDIKEFKKLYDSDTHPNKEESAQFFRLLYLAFDPDSRYYAMVEDERLDFIDTHMIGGKDSFFKKFSSLIDIYKRMLNSTHEKVALIVWQNQIEKRLKFLNETNYTPANYKMLEDMAKMTPTLLKQRDEIEDMIRAKESEKVRGDQALSLAAKGDIMAEDKINTEESLVKHLSSHGANQPNE